MKQLLRQFRRDDAGSLSIETVIVYPFLVWILVFCLVAWDGYKLKGFATGATFTIGDLISRQSSVDDDFIAGMENIFARISQRAADTDIRVSVVRLRSVPNADPVMELYWTDGTGTAGELPDHTNIDDFRDRVPLMAPDSSLIFVETIAKWEPPIATSVFGDMTFYESAFFSPRFLEVLGNPDRVSSGS